MDSIPGQPSRNLISLDWLRSNSTLVLAAGGIVLSMLIGYEVATAATRLLEVTGVFTVTLVTVRWPRQAIPFAIPAMLLLDRTTGGAVELLIPFACVVAWLVHLLMRTIRIRLLEQGVLFSLASWLMLAYLIDAVHLETVLSPGHDLLTFLLGLIICGVAISFRPSPTWILAATAAASAMLALVILIAPDPTPAARVYALDLNPNSLGLALAMGVIASVVGWLGNHRNPAWVIAAALCVFALRLTESRGAFVSVLVGLATITLLGRRRWLQALVVAGAAAILLVPGLSDYVMGFAFGSRTVIALDDSNAIRISAAATAVRYSVDNPIFGVGYGQFAALASRDALFAVYLNTHNDFLRLAAESGLPALALFLALSTIAIFRGDWRRSLPLKALLLTYLVGLLFGNFLSSLLVTTPFWLCLGTLLSGSADESRRTREDQARNPVGVLSFDRQRWRRDDYEQRPD